MPVVSTAPGSRQLAVPLPGFCNAKVWRISSWNASSATESLVGLAWTCQDQSSTPHTGDADA